MWLEGGGTVEVSEDLAQVEERLEQEEATRRRVAFTTADGRRLIVLPARVVALEEGTQAGGGTEALGPPD
jgi:hypothetical protein